MKGCSQIKSLEITSKESVVEGVQYVTMCMHISCIHIYIYIYIYWDRERERLCKGLHGRRARGPGDEGAAEEVHLWRAAVAKVSRSGVHK